MAAGCGVGNDENVMVPEATPLTEAQVERALGPELQEGLSNVAEQPAVADSAVEVPEDASPPPTPPAESPDEQERPPEPTNEAQGELIE